MQHEANPFAKLIPRRLDQDEGDQKEQQCMISYLACLLNPTCARCISSLQDENVDWFYENNPDCDKGLMHLTEHEKCTDLSMPGQEFQKAKSMFCLTYDTCKSTDEDFVDEGDDAAYYEGEDDDDKEGVDCDNLTECKWEGMHLPLLGNGMCNREACYNTVICNYDGGDCCEDTCTGNTFAECGVDGYACVNPKSANCTSALTSSCIDDDSSDENVKPKPKMVCNSTDEKLLKLSMFDSWGNGWGDGEENRLVIQSVTHSGNDEDYTYHLDEGHKGYDVMCLAPGCYSAKIGSGGQWSQYHSWSVTAGSSSVTIAKGGAPVDCNFSVGGYFCDTTCTNDNSDEDKAMDEDLKKCVETKCPIQIGECAADHTSCALCLKDDTLPFCVTNFQFNAVVNCMICSCFAEEETKGCEDAANKRKDFKCTSEQTTQGTAALAKYSTCTNVDQTLAIFKDWDENRFGRLDEFEACAHSFAKDGKGKALECMNILASIVRDPISEDEKDNSMIATIANMLYTDPEGVCDCTVAANTLCPDCDKFSHFKILMHETLDACNSVDEVDCASWEEFSTPCKEKLHAVFGSVDFSQERQCAYVSNDCGGVGAFPTFRHLDCEGEISKESWDFFKYLNTGCQHQQHVPTMAPAPAYTSPTITSSPINNVVPTPYTPSQPTRRPTKPYVPPSDGKHDNGGSSPSSNSSSSSGSGSDSHSGRILWSVLLMGGVIGGYVFYKRRARTFTYSYHRPPAATQADGNYMGATDLFAGLNVNPMSVDATSYEPVMVPGGEKL